MNRTLCLLLVGGALLCSVREMRGQTSSEAQTVTLKREYRNGETIAYHMKAVNEGHLRTVRYEAEASARVRLEPTGPFSESFA